MFCYRFDLCESYSFCILFCSSSVPYTYTVRHVIVIGSQSQVDLLALDFSSRFDFYFRF